jgi:hypothetical protein
MHHDPHEEFTKKRKVPNKGANDENLDDDPFVFVEGGINDSILLGIEL